MIALLICTRKIPPAASDRRYSDIYNDFIKVGSEGTAAPDRPIPIYIPQTAESPPMRQKELELALSKVPPFPNPDPSLEQYPTPANIAAEIIHSAYMAGDIEGRIVADLGCGTGVFSVGAALMGARVTGFDVSAGALEEARRFAGSLGLDIDFVETDISAVDFRADTVLMNPPFGSQRKHADRPFLEKALDIADAVYSIHMANSVEFVQKLAEAKGRQVRSCKIYKYTIPHTFSFHKKEKQAVEIAAVMIS